MYDKNKEIEPIKIIKIGGHILENIEDLDIFLLDFHKLPGKKILVHGGGAELSRFSAKLEIKSQLINGRRITDSETLKLATMIYAGYINKTIVAKLQKYGTNALGISGADANTISSRKRSPRPIDYGFVGDPILEEINTSFLLNMLQNDIIPIFCSITHDRNGSLLNTNADTIAYSIAVSLSRSHRTVLYYCLEKLGVMQDINDPDSLIKSISEKEFKQYLNQNIIADGMIPKLQNSFKAINQGVSEVLILNYKNLLSAIGTKIINDYER